MKTKPRLLRVTTVPVSLKLLLRGQLSYMRQNGFEVMAVSADGPEVSDLELEGISHQIVPMTRRITPVKDLICLFKLIAVIKKFQPHIVHSHTPKAGLLAMMAAWACRVPVRIHTVAGLPLTEAKGGKRWLLKYSERITYFCAHHIYPNSKGLMDFIASEFKIRYPKMKMIGKGSTNGIDINYFARAPMIVQQAAKLKTDYGISQNSIVFCFMGRIVRDKGINELVEAFDKLSMQIPAHLILVGPFEDDLDPVSDESRNTLKKNKNIICTGYQQDVRPFMLASDIFVFPSYREGFPNVVMQACCLKVPCIVSEINGCNEIISDGETGVIIKPKDTNALYAAMAHLSQAPSLREKFATAAHDYIIKNFEQSSVWRQLLKEYKTLLKIPEPG